MQYLPSAATASELICSLSVAGQVTAARSMAVVAGQQRAWWVRVRGDR